MKKIVGLIVGIMMMASAIAMPAYKSTTVATDGEVRDFIVYSDKISDLDEIGWLLALNYFKDNVATSNYYFETGTNNNNYSIVINRGKKDAVVVFYSGRIYHTFETTANIDGFINVLDNVIP